MAGSCCPATANPNPNPPIRAAAGSGCSAAAVAFSWTGTMLLPKHTNTHLPTFLQLTTCDSSIALTNGQLINSSLSSIFALPRPLFHSISLSSSPHAGNTFHLFLCDFCCPTHHEPTAVSAEADSALSCLHTSSDPITGSNANTSPDGFR